MPRPKNQRKALYVEYNVAGNSKEKSLELAGYKMHRGSVARLEKDPEVIAYRAELAKKTAEKVELSVERVLEEMMRLAFYDPTIVFDSIGGKLTMKDPTALPEDLRRAITRIKPVEDGRYEIWLADKQKALEMLGRHLQMFKETIRVENVFAIVRDMDDSDLDRRLAELERVIAEATGIDSGAGEGPAAIH